MIFSVDTGQAWFWNVGSLEDAELYIYFPGESKDYFGCSSDWLDFKQYNVLKMEFSPAFYGFNEKKVEIPTIRFADEG